MGFHGGERGEVGVKRRKEGRRADKPAFRGGELGDQVRGLVLEVDIGEYHPVVHGSAGVAQDSAWALEGRRVERGLLPVCGVLGVEISHHKVSRRYTLEIFQTQIALVRG